ncbi:hypothetical protein G9A89_015038 [Geosiphon pyriformis]|nr:hypothetical protein G9A89_015038 [Geosiphon pyriformis]
MGMEFRKSLDQSIGEPLWALIDMIVRADDEAFSVSAISALRECSRVKPPLQKMRQSNLYKDLWMISG